MRLFTCCPWRWGMCCLPQSSPVHIVCQIVQPTARCLLSLQSTAVFLRAKGKWYSFTYPSKRVLWGLLAQFTHLWVASLVLDATNLLHPLEPRPLPLSHLPSLKPFFKAYAAFLSPSFRNYCFIIMYIQFKGTFWTTDHFRTVVESADLPPHNFKPSSTEFQPKLPLSPTMGRESAGEEEEEEGEQERGTKEKWLCLPHLALLSP